MTLIVWTHFAYLGISIALTVWVARTLHRNGRVFLVDCFHGNAELADAVNHLLVVGFYLINMGFVALFLSLGREPSGLVGGIEYISVKIGIVLLVLGVMHFFNMFNFARMRRKGLRGSDVAAAPAHAATA